MIYAAFAVGAFYVFAGFVVLRAMAMERVMDRVLAALNDPPDAKDRARTGLLTLGGYLTFASGVALALISPFALPLFLVNAAVQGGYLAWAERALPPEGDAEAKGRRQTKNAFVIYLAATAFVAWLAYQGLLRPWNAPLEVLAADLAIVGAALGAVLGFIHWPSSDRPGATGDGFVGPSALEDEVPPSRLRLAPEFHCSPLWNAETGEPVSVFRLGLPEELAARIEAWDDTWQATYREDDPAASAFASESERTAYVEEGRAIAAALKEIWGGELEIAEEFR